jgi:hypothetical protein
LRPSSFVLLRGGFLTSPLRFLGRFLAPIRQFRESLGARTQLLRLTDNDVISLAARAAALDQDHTVILADLDDLEVLAGAAHLTHVTRHLETLVHVTREQTATNGTRAAMPTLGTVRHIATAETPAADDTFKTTALRDANAIHVLADIEDIHVQKIARLHFLGEVTELLDLLDGRQLELTTVFTLAVRLHSMLGHMAENRLRQTTNLLVAKRELNSAVAVGFLILHLENPVGPSQNHRHRCRHSIRVINARVAQFKSDQS